jgi:hypothetical protein
MKLGPGEPAAGPWRVERLTTFARSLIDSGPPPRPRVVTVDGGASAGPGVVEVGGGAPAGPGVVEVGSGAFPRPRVVAVDGRGGAGKSTLAERLRLAIPGSVVVHTDDVAWWHSRFGWADLMADGVLAPLRAGRDVRFQPPAWAPRGRAGHIEVPAGGPAVIVEGVGAARRDLTHLIDVAVWIQSDYDEAERRGIRRDIERDGEDPDTALRKWWEWADVEVPFLLEDRPWERADHIVAGTPALPHDAATDVVTAPPLHRSGAPRPPGGGA